MIAAKCALRGLCGGAPDHEIVAWNHPRSRSSSRGSCAASTMRVGVAVRQAQISARFRKEETWVVFPLAQLRTLEGSILYAAPCLRMGLPMFEPAQTEANKTYLSREDVWNMRVKDCLPEIKAAATVMVSHLVERDIRTRIICDICGTHCPMQITTTLKSATESGSYSFLDVQRRNFVSAKRMQGAPLTDWEMNNYVLASHARAWWVDYIWFQHRPCFGCKKWSCCQKCRACYRPVVQCSCEWKRTRALLESAHGALRVQHVLHKNAVRAFNTINCEKQVLRCIQQKTAEVDDEVPLSRNDVRVVINDLLASKHISVGDESQLDCLFELAAFANAKKSFVVDSFGKACRTAKKHASDSHITRESLTNLVVIDPCVLLHYFYTK